jgi:hypothetical protein
MIIFGWGKGSRVLGDGFLQTCSHCGNTNRFLVVEESSNVNVYFVTVASFANQYFYVCPVCYCGASVPDRAMCQRILANAIRNPNGADADLRRLIKQSRA